METMLSEARERGVPGREAVGRDEPLQDDRTPIDDKDSSSSIEACVVSLSGSCATAASAGVRSSLSGGGPCDRDTPRACTWSSAAAARSDGRPSSSPAETRGPHHGGGCGSGFAAVSAKMEGGVPRGARATISERSASAAAETDGRRDGARASNCAGATSCGANCRSSPCSIHRSATSRVVRALPPGRWSSHGHPAASHEESKSRAKSQLSWEEKANAKAPKKRSAKFRAKAPITSATSASMARSPLTTAFPLAGPMAARSSSVTARGSFVERKRSRSRSASADPQRSRNAAARGAASACPSMTARVWQKSTAMTRRLFGGIRVVARHSADASSPASPLSKRCDSTSSSGRRKCSAPGGKPRCSAPRQTSANLASITSDGPSVPCAARVASSSLAASSKRCAAREARRAAAVSASKSQVRSPSGESASGGSSIISLSSS
eukprot:scaffold87586_cov32-Tisochrysis_lutea.AAC.10